MLSNTTAAPRHVLQRQLAFLWVRRHLLLLPLLLSIPLGLLLSYLLPRPHVASTLILLQESGGGFLRTRENTSVQPHQAIDRLNGIQAVLKSDRVLSAVVRELNSGGQPLNAKDLQRAVIDLKGAITLSMPSSDILEVRLKGSSPVGMGKTLETITASFLDSLLLPEDVVLPAPQLIVEWHRKKVGAAERAYEKFLQRHKEQPAGGSGAATGKSERLTTLMSTQLQARTQINRLRTELSLKDGQAVRLDASINAARARLAELGSSSDAPRLDVTIAQKHLERLIELETQERLYAQRQTELDRLAGTAVDGQSPGTSADAIEQERSQLSAALKAAETKLSETERRFGSRLGSNTLQILKAPEQITIIDAPSDPEFPALTRFSILIFSVMTGALLGFGLALVAEYTDPRLRSAEALIQATGAPVWGRLPPAA